MEYGISHGGAGLLQREFSEEGGEVDNCLQTWSKFVLDQTFRLTLAKRHWSIPLVDALWSTGAGGSGLTNQVEAPVTAEAQGTAKLCARQAVYRAVHRRVRNTAIRRCKKYKYKHSQKSKTHPVCI